MSETCETVRIVSESAPGGYAVINKDDFNPDKHTVYQEPLKSPDNLESASEPATIDEMLDDVKSKGGKKK